MILACIGSQLGLPPPAGAGAVWCRDVRRVRVIVAVHEIWAAVVELLRFPQFPQAARSLWAHVWVGGQMSEWPRRMRWWAGERMSLCVGEGEHKKRRARECEGPAVGLFGLKLAQRACNGVRIDTVNKGDRFMYS